jgi:hypothetical protein
VARELHVLPSVVRTMPALDYNRFVEFYNAEGRSKENREKRRAVEKGRQERKGRR